MDTKATVKDIVNMGFSAAHFGNDGRFAVDNAGGYIYDILQRIALEISGTVGASIYTAASSTGSEEEQLTFSRLQQAEMNLCAAELVSRRIIFLENSTMRQTDKLDMIMSELRKNAQRYEDSAWRFIALITGTQQNGSFSTGILETGAYPALT